MQKHSAAFTVAVTTALFALAKGLQAAPTTQPVADVPVKEVVLFSSGVGYFEHFGTVQGDGSTELRFKTNQINDILKSLVLQDLDGGKVSAVTYVTHKLVQTQDYVAQNKSDHDKVLIIEHPRQGGWELVDTAVPVEKTDSVYRFSERVGAGKTEKLTVKEQIVTDETVMMNNLDTGPLEYYRQQGSIPKPVMDALAKVIQMRQAMADTQRQIDQNKSHLSDITSEQSRIRDNLKAVKDTSQYYTHLMEKLNDQETDIEKTQKADADLQVQLDKQRGELETYLANLNV